MANIETDGKTATLSQAGKKMLVRALAPGGAKFEAIDVKIPAPQRPAAGLKKLMLKWSGKVAQVDVIVVFSAVDDSTELKIEPLAKWPGKID